eukprot:g2696.t1
METRRRQTQSIGGSSGNEFRAPQGEYDITELDFYFTPESLNGITATYANGTVQRIGSIHGNKSRISNLTDNRQIRAITVYTSERNSNVQGIKTVLRNGSEKLYGEETTNFRTISFPRDSRLVGINGRHNNNQPVSLSFTYLASREAFDPGFYSGRSNDENFVNNGDEARARVPDGDVETSTDLLTNIAIIGATIGAIWMGWSLFRWPRLA